MCLIHCDALICILQYLVSVPLKMFRMWAFMGMMAQVRHVQLSQNTFSLNTLSASSQTCRQTRWPLNFHLRRFLWLGLWDDFWLETMATPPCGSHSSLASLSLCWCTSTTTISIITGPQHSTASTYVRLQSHTHTHTPACGTSHWLNVENVKVTIMERHSPFSKPEESCLDISIFALAWSGP